MLWRRLRSAGAVGLQNGVWLLPHDQAQQQFAEEMLTYVQSRNGSAHAFVVEALSPTVQADLEARFRAVRAQEYGEFAEQCTDFLAEIEKEIARSNYSFAELEENEEDLAKLDRWLARIRARDVIADKPDGNADALLEECHRVLEGFAERVYAAESQEPSSGITGEGDGPETKGVDGKTERT